MENNNSSFEGMLKRMVIAPAARKAAAVQSALALLDGKPPDRMLYGGAEAARLLSISTQTLWRMVRAVTIQTVKIRGSTRYRRADLLALAGGEGGQV